MKRVLLNTLEPGRICEVVEPGNEFEVAPSFYWIDAPDNVTTSHTYDDGNFIEYDPTKRQDFVENGYKLARQIGYKSVGEQLDMLYKELQQTGSISSSGTWSQHITSIKQAIPKDNPAVVLQWIRDNPPE